MPIFAHATQNLVLNKGSALLLCATLLKSRVLYLLSFLMDGNVTVSTYGSWYMKKTRNSFVFFLYAIHKARYCSEQILKHVPLASWKQFLNENDYY